ncbi:hypothetical protein EV421DRAFT_1981188 [Armillaria borealis]|uniref:Uncharacterized protein n=1 Tax=Armillaria borealis TaxID=47425 RepID=A0AA39J5U0_9AGAR|nr:hypothetical protein EV421DRAFT_1981188 [Armillaria borealis]
MSPSVRPKKSKDGSDVPNYRTDWTLESCCPTSLTEDDLMLITVFNLRLEEQLSQLEKMKMCEALLVIAEPWDSERLPKFMAWGSDHRSSVYLGASYIEYDLGGEITAPTHPNWPRVSQSARQHMLSEFIATVVVCVHELALQYFYTIKNLREAVSAGKKGLNDDEKLSDDLKRHRVGGSLVIRHEILEDEVDKGGADSSNDTDATLVDDGPVQYLVEPPSSPKSPSRSLGSILEKHTCDIPRRPSGMEVDTPSYSPREDRSSGSSPRLSDDNSPPPLIPLNYPEGSASGSKDEDVEMQAICSSNKPPPSPRIAQF